MEPGFVEFGPHGTVKTWPLVVPALNRLAAHIEAKEECLFKLIQFCAVRPELPVSGMYAEYSTALDVVALQEPRQLKLEVSDEEVGRLGADEQEARKDRIRTRHRLAGAAEELATRRPGEWTMKEVSSRAEVSLSALREHFPTHSQLVVAAYEFLMRHD